MSYASSTTVPWLRTRMEIESLLLSKGATSFGFIADGDACAIAFRLAGRSVRIMVPMPRRDDVSKTPTGRARSAPQIDEQLEQERRRRWRSLLFIVKAKLTAVEDGISTIEREFLADVVMSDGRTVSEALRPALANSAGGKAPLLIPPAIDSTG